MQATGAIGLDDPTKIGVTATSTPGDFDAADPLGKLIDVIYSLGAAYRANATFVMNSKVAGRLRKLKDADGRFAVQDAGEQSIGSVAPFHGVIPNIVRAYAWLRALGPQGLRAVAEIAPEVDLDPDTAHPNGSDAPHDAEGADGEDDQS